MQPRIIPAILQQTFGGIAEAVACVSDIASYVQIDIVDGIHAPNTTWPFFTEHDMRNEIGRLDNLHIAYELDLMISTPERLLRHFLKTNVSRCIIHLSSTRHMEQCIQQVRDAGREIYVGIVIGDNLADLEKYINQIDGVQCMGIRHIGAQGAPFDEQAVGLIEAARLLRPAVPVTVDGGISAHTLPMLAEAGVSQFAVGSALFRGDVKENFTHLTRML